MLAAITKSSKKESKLSTTRAKNRVLAKLATSNIVFILSLRNNALVNISFNRHFIRSFFAEASNNTAQQSQLNPIWSRHENSGETRESLQKLINLAEMHGLSSLPLNLIMSSRNPWSMTFMKFSQGRSNALMQISTL